VSSRAAGDLADLLAGSVVDAARGLLGRRIRSDVDGTACEAVITEVEAYGGEDDAASHAHRGRTRRNAAMYGPPGTLYVYRSYGIHWCANVTVGAVDVPGAVLLRGGLPVAGEGVMRRRRRRSDHLADGPGKLAQALAITGEHDGTSVFDGPVRIVGDQVLTGAVVAGPRVGVTRAADRPWRFVMATPVGSLPALDRRPSRD
jgi:DNA-3-methyladenine glycosylase